LSKRVAISILVFIVTWLVGQTGVLAYESDNIKDDLNYLTVEEVKEVQDSIEKTVSDYNLDMIIVITDNTQGKSSRDFADDYYDYNGFGAGDDHSGLLMLINMDKREIWISTTGSAIDIFTDDTISKMTDAIAGFLSKGSFYDACKEFISEVSFYAERGVPEGQYRIDTETAEEVVPDAQQGADQKTSNSYLNKVFRQMTSLPVYIGALLIAIIATIIASLSNKSSVQVDEQTYEIEDSFLLSDSSDDYIRESTTSVKIVRNNSSSSSHGSNSSGSSTHRSSSGGTHGGGGRSF